MPESALGDRVLLQFEIQQYCSEQRAIYQKALQVTHFRSVAKQKNTAVSSRRQYRGSAACVWALIRIFESL